MAKELGDNRQILVGVSKPAEIVQQFSPVNKFHLLILVEVVPNKKVLHTAISVNGFVLR